MFIGANQSESGNFKRCGNRQKGNELERHIADRKYHAHLLMMRTNEPDWLLNYCLLFKQKKNVEKLNFYSGLHESFVRRLLGRFHQLKLNFKKLNKLAGPNEAVTFRGNFGKKLLMSSLVLEFQVTTVA